MDTCKNCKHWRPQAFPDRLHDCAKREELISDAPGGMGSSLNDFYPGPDFGCIKHDKRQKVPPLPSWQPFETAPRDGTLILAYRRGVVGVAARVQRDDCEMWSFAGETAAFEIYPRHRPSHWTSLPLPLSNIQYFT